MLTALRSRVLFAMLLVLAGGSLAVKRWQDNAVQPITVFLVRHAETTTDTRTNPDPPLSEAGQKRAEELAELLAAAGVTHLFSSEYVRTQTTLGPLAEACGLEVQVVSGRDQAGQVQALRDLPPGSVAVVSGHSNTVPGMARALVTTPEAQGGTAPPPANFAHEEHHRLLLVTLPAGEGMLPKQLELRFGDAPQH